MGSPFRHQSEFGSALARNNEDDSFSYELMFPHHRPVAARHIVGVSLLTAEVCDLDTGPGLALATMGHDPLLTNHFAGLGRRNRDE